MYTNDELNLIFENKLNDILIEACTSNLIIVSDKFENFNNIEKCLRNLAQYKLNKVSFMLINNGKQKKELFDYIDNLKYNISPLIFGFVNNNNFKYLLELVNFLTIREYDIYDYENDVLEIHVD